MDRSGFRLGPGGIPASRRNGQQPQPRSPGSARNGREEAVRLESRADQRLFTSSIYTGCFSKFRRWRPGIKIICDALYWLPLIQFTIGPRPEEAAALPDDSVRLRDGILCFAFEMRPDARQKNEASERLVPVSDLLLRLGFAEWWRNNSCCRATVPELPASATDGKLLDLFGKSWGQIFEHLGIRDARRTSTLVG